MWHQWFNRNFTKLRKYFLYAKKTKIMTLFNNSPRHPRQFFWLFATAFEPFILPSLFVFFESRSTVLWPARPLLPSHDENKNHLVSLHPFILLLHILFFPLRDPCLLVHFKCDRLKTSTRPQLRQAPKTSLQRLVYFSKSATLGNPFLDYKGTPWTHKGSTYRF